MLPTSSPRQPIASSPCHFFSRSPRPSLETPRILTRYCARRVSCRAYVRRTSSSGNRKRKTRAVVSGGSGEYRSRNAWIHRLNVLYAGESVGCAPRGCFSDALCGLIFATASTSSTKLGCNGGEYVFGLSLSRILTRRRVFHPPRRELP